MTTPELPPSPFPGADAGTTGLGVAGVSLASCSTASSSTSVSASKTPRWGSIRQRFSSIHTRDSPSVPVDSVDDAMWDKNDAAFLEEVARDSPLLLSSVQNSPAPPPHDSYARRSSLSSSRVNSFVQPNDNKALPPTPSAPSTSSSNSPASPAYAFPTSSTPHDPVPGSVTTAFVPLKNWPHLSRKISSVTALPDLPEQNRVDDVTTFSRPSTSSSSAASSSMPPPLLPPIASSNSFMAPGFLQSPSARSSAHSSLASSPLLAHSIHATGDAARSNISDQYPRSPSLHSASSFTTPTSPFRSFEDRTQIRGRTISSNSAVSSAFASPISPIERRTSRSAVGSPLAVATSYSHPRPPSPEPDWHHQQDAFLLLAHAPADGALIIDNEPRPSIAGVLEPPYLASSSPSSSSAGHTHHSARSLSIETTGHTENSAAATRKRLATASMRGLPGNTTKKSSSTIASASTLFPISSSAVADSSSTANSVFARKHTKNKSSLVSGLRKLMGKREKEGRSAALASHAAPSAETMQPSAGEGRSLRSRACSIDAPPGSGLNLVGLASDALGSNTTIQSPSDLSRQGSSNVHASPSEAHGSPSLDLLRSFATSAKVSQADPDSSEAHRAQQASSPSPRSRTKSVDGLPRSLREVLGQRPRKDSSNKAAARDSIIEHISHNEARRLTGTSGPVYLPDQKALAEHRSRYASSPPATGMPDRALFDMEHDQADRHQTRLPSRSDALSYDTDSVEMLSPSDSGGAISATNSGSHTAGGRVSSGSSFVSCSTAATDPSVMTRAPFSFQSQSYRPYSRESRASSKEQSSPALGSNVLSGHVSSDSATSVDAVSGALRPSHRNVSSLGSQAAFSSIYGGSAPDAPTAGTSTVMPPPSGVPTAKRGHNSRRSLNSLVGSRPWSSLLGSPGLGSNSSHSHHHRRISAASISRPLSVSSSAFSSDPYFASVDEDGVDGNAGDLTLRASDFQSRPNSSDPAWPNGTVGATSNNNVSSTHGRSSCHSPPPIPTPPGPHFAALAPPAALAQASAPALGHAISPSSSSQHSHQSHHSQHSHQSFHSYNSGTSAPLPTRGSVFVPSHRLAQKSSTSSSSASSASNFAIRQQSVHQRPTTCDGSTSPPLASLGSLPSIGAGIAANTYPSPLIQSSSSDNLEIVRFAAKPASATALGFASAPRPQGVGHRLSASGSSLSHRKRPSFGLAIEPAAHSAFDSIPSPLLRTRGISLALPESASPERPFSTSSTSAARTPSASSFSTSSNPSARASAATLSSSSHVSDRRLDNVEIETLREDSPTKLSRKDSTPLLATVPALESAMAAASLQSFADHRHSVSVPMDEGDSPRQHIEESWDRATGGVAARLSFSGGDDAHGHAPRQYMIHSPNEEEGPALAVHETASISKSGRMSQATKDIAFGSIAGMVSKVFEHPFDLVKVRLQTQSADCPARYAGAFDCFKQTYLQEGIRGLYRGLSMPVFGATLENACLFFTYNQIQSAIRWFNGQARKGSAAQADAEAPLSIPQLAIAAAGAGSLTSVVLTPIELIKCKMQVQMITRELHAPITSAAASSAAVQPQLQQTRSLFTNAVRSAASAGSSSCASAPALKALDGPLALLRRTIATDGIRGLWLGQTGTLLRETGGGVAWFLAFESCSRYLIARKKAQYKRDDITKKDLSSLELVGAGALAGISYNVVLFPADSVKSTMQTEQEMRAVSSAALGEKWKGTGFFDTFRKIYTTRGVRGLYAGCGVTCLRSAPSSAIIFLMYNKLERLSDAYGL